MRKRSQGLSLNIFATPEKTGIRSAKQLPLYVNAVSAPYVPHKLNWDYSLSAPTVFDIASTGYLEFDLLDYSSNIYDYYHDVVKGTDAVNYNLQSKWYINDVDMVDDIAMVATEDWMSTERYTFELTDAVLSVDRIANAVITCNQPPCDLPMYNYEYQFTTADTGSGTITVSYVDECGSSKTRTIAFDTGTAVPPITIIQCSSSVPTLTYSGTGTHIPDIDGFQLVAGNPNCNPVVVADGCTNTQYSTANRNCCSNTFYAYPIRDSDQPSVNDKELEISLRKARIYTTPINIKSLSDILQNPNFLRPPYANTAITPLSKLNTNKEYPDYSDVYIEIDYQDGASTTDNIMIQTGQPTKYLYSFGGIITDTEYLARCSAISPEISFAFEFNQYYYPYGDPYKPKGFTDDGSYKWYIVVRSTNGEYLLTTLSSYMLPTTRIKDTDVTNPSLTSLYSKSPLLLPNFKKIANKPTEDGAFLSPLTEGTFLLKNNNISTKSTIKLIKLANYPNCGKVDIYTRKGGPIHAYTGKTVTSSGHALSNGDSVKFSSALSISGVTNLNGIRYVSGTTTHTFDIYADKNCNSGVFITNLKSITGVSWTTVSKDNWKYNHSIYSPMGKNGYGFSEKLRAVAETGVFNTGIYATPITPVFRRAVESSTVDGLLTKPQAYLNSWTSWNNFYPFTRVSQKIDGITVFDRDFDNGNKFGSDCQISKVSDNNYVAMITEPGAVVSFELYEDFYSKTYKPTNKKVLPHYFPYGKIHFYNITKDPYSISYMTSISQTGNPWAAYESVNRISKREGYNYTTNRYEMTVDNSGVNTTLKTNTNHISNDSYWVGGRFYSWIPNYVYDTELTLNMPEWDKFHREFGFLDSFGTSAAFEIQDNILYGVGSTFVKNANFYTGDRVLNVDGLSLSFTLNLSTLQKSAPSGLVYYTSYTTNITDNQIAEMEMYAQNTDFDNGKLFIGWPSTNRFFSEILIRNRVGSGYISSDVLFESSTNTTMFGNYFIAHNGFLVTNAYSPTDDSGAITDPALNYLYVYKKEPTTDIYSLVQRICPTIDLDNRIYQTFEPFNVVMTNNLSYENTTTNSASRLDSAFQPVNLEGRYDVYGNSLVIRDYNEYAYYTYDSTEKKFKIRNHNLISNKQFNPQYETQRTDILTDTAVVRMAPSTLSYVDKNPTSEFITSLQVIEGSDTLGLTNIVGQSYPLPNYLPLVIYTTDGAEKSITLDITGMIEVNSGIPLYTLGEVPLDTGVTLFCKQIDQQQSGMPLTLKIYDIRSTGVSLFMAQNYAMNGIPLILAQENFAKLPMFMKAYDRIIYDNEGKPIEIPSGDIGKYIIAYDDITSLYIENYHTGVPNASGGLTCVMVDMDYSDHADIFNMYIEAPPAPIQINDGMSLFTTNLSGISPGSTPSYNATTLFIQPDEFFTGESVNGALNLVVKRIPEAQTPLFVYNTYNHANVNLYLPSANPVYTGITLYTSGESFAVENNGSKTLHIRGKTI
jgi:hypothetical protein